VTKIETKTFSELTNRELFDIYKLRVAVFVVEQKCPYQEVDDDDLISYHLTFRDDTGDLMAYLRIIPDEKETIARIGRVIVAKDYRGKGLAKQLVQKALEESVRLIPNANKIVLAGQAYLKDFYHSFGFHDVSDVYLEDDIPHIDMEKSV
jgi:ElaA protein